MRGQLGLLANQGNTGDHFTHLFNEHTKYTSSNLGSYNITTVLKLFKLYLFTMHSVLPARMPSQ